MRANKILVLRLSSIGDIVLSTPVIRALRTQLDDTEIHYCTKKEFAPLLTDNPYVDRIQLLDNSLSKLIIQLKKEKYDHIIDLHNNFRTGIIKFLLRKPSLSFRKLNFEKWLMVRLKINKLPNIHVVERYLDTIKPLGIKTDSLGLDYFIPEKDIVDKNWIPGTHREKYVVYGIGGQKSTKRLPFDKMIELCAKINMPIILVGAKQDEEIGNKLEDFFINIPENKEYEPGLLKMNKKTKVYNAAGKFNINQSASIIKGAEFVFTHDTAVMHIAAAFRKKIFTIWGNTIPLFGMYPYRTKFWVFENSNLECRPCSKIGFNKCPKKHFKCMNDIVFDFYLE